MKILSASVVSAVTGFLHAGYLSASSVPIFPQPIPRGVEYISDPVVKLDMAQALQLKGEAVAATATNTDTGLLAGWLGSLGPFPTLLAGVLSLFGLIALLYIVRERWRFVPATAGALPLALLVALVTITCSSAEPPIPEAPWLGLEIKSYENPEAATLAIMYGILGPAIENRKVREQNAASVLEEVGLPTKAPTPGMTYALQSYGLDGWGNAFELGADPEREGYIVVVSSGPDGVFGNDDDISDRFLQNDDDYAESPSSVFLTNIDDDHVVFYHRINSKEFASYHVDEALAYTGNELFECIINFNYDEPAPEEVIELLKDSYRDMAADKAYMPLVLYVFD